MPNGPYESVIGTLFRRLFANRRVRAHVWLGFLSCFEAICVVGFWPCFGVCSRTDGFVHIIAHVWSGFLSCLKPSVLSGFGIVSAFVREQTGSALDGPGAQAAAFTIIGHEKPTPTPTPTTRTTTNTTKQQQQQCLKCSKQPQQQQQRWPQRPSGVATHCSLHQATGLRS